MNTPAILLFDTGGLGLTAARDGAGHLDLDAATRVDHAVAMSYGHGADTRQNGFLVATPLKLPASVSAYCEERTVVYTEPGAQTVELSYLESGSAPFGGAASGLVSGFATIK